MDLGTKEIENRTSNQMLNSVNELGVAVESRPLTDLEKHVRADYIHHLKEIKNLKCLNLKQKSREKWALDGDENSKFCHILMKKNTSSNRINGLIIGGDWSTDPSAIKEEVFSHFKNRFTENNQNTLKLFSNRFRKLTGEHCSFLESSFSMAQIKDGVCDCGNDKAPSPDGFNFNFIKRFWNELAPDFKELMDYFHSTGIISKGVNSSFLALIPKRPVVYC